MPLVVNLRAAFLACISASLASVSVRGISSSWSSSMSICWSWLSSLVDPFRVSRSACLRASAMARVSGGLTLVEVAPVCCLTLCILVVDIVR